MAVLGLEPDAASRCLGAVVRVTGPELLLLAERERNYALRDVTALVDRPATAGPGPVLVFEPLPESTRLLRTAPEVAVRSSYLELVEAAFESLGPRHHEEYRRTTPPPPFPVLPLTAVLSPRGAPPRRP